MTKKSKDIDRETMAAAIQAVDEMFNGEQPGEPAEWERDHAVFLATYPFGRAGYVQMISNGIRRDQMAAILHDLADKFAKELPTADTTLGGLRIGAKIKDRPYAAMLAQGRTGTLIEKAWAEYRDKVLGPGGYDLQDAETMEAMRTTYFSGVVTSFMYAVGIMQRQNEGNLLKSIDDELTAFMMRDAMDKH